MAGSITQAPLVKSNPTTSGYRLDNVYVLDGKLILEYVEGEMAIQQLTLDPAAQNLSDQSVPVRNETGGELPAGTLVYLSGWDEVTERWLIDRSQAKPHKGVLAQFILRTPLAALANGDAYRSHRLVGLDTSGQAVGVAVYLSDDTAGGFEYSVPKHAQQQVGRVAVVDAIDGEIEFLVMPSTDSDLVRSKPNAGDNPVRAMRRRADGIVEIDYDDVPVT